MPGTVLSVPEIEPTCFIAAGGFGAGGFGAGGFGAGGFGAGGFGAGGFGPGEISFGGQVLQSQTS